MNKTRKSYKYIELNNRKLYLPPDHLFPLYYQRYPHYDRALPRICQYLSKIDKRLILVDIGANIGDSVFLITQKTKGSFLCVEGNPQYLPYLKKNLSLIKGSATKIISQYCGQYDGTSHYQVVSINGTAKIINQPLQEKSEIIFKKLDTIINQNPYYQKANFLKIDTDGYEISVLEGATTFLSQSKPVIHLEFTPDLYINNHQDPFRLFKILQQSGYKHVLFYNNFGIPIGITEISQKRKISSLINKIDNKNIYYLDLLTYHSDFQIKYQPLFSKELFSTITLFQNSLENTPNSTILKLETEIKKKNEALQKKSISLNKIKDELNTTRNNLYDSQKQLNQIYSSRGWRALHFYHNLRENIKIKFLPKTIPIKNSPPIVNSAPFPQAPKIVYIGHSYHTKTKSTKFIIDSLKKKYQVVEILDNSWQGGQFPDLSFINQSYKAIIFFQNLPSANIVNNLNNNNLIFFPMYDNYGHQDISFLKEYKNVRYINFSSTLHHKIKSLGLPSIYVQYFPRQLDYINIPEIKVFFWQRSNKININLVEQLIGKTKATIHIHKAIDPSNTFTKPTLKQELKFKITYSNWFNTRKEAQQIIQTCSIYIAPREFEGIGLSFLEAMSMGKAVVAPNNPTMSEYIQNNQTGYLYDISNPLPINFKNLSKIQKNVRRFYPHGRSKWLSDQDHILNFINNKL